MKLSKRILKIANNGLNFISKQPYEMGTDEEYFKMQESLKKIIRLVNDSETK